MRRATLVLLACATLVGLLWWSKGPRAPADVPSADHVGEVPAPAALAAPARPADLPAPAAEPAHEVREATREPLEADPGPGPHFVVRVVDEEDRPVAGADVRFVDLAAAYEDSPWTEPSELVGRDLDALFARLGHGRRTDDAGIARFARTEVGGLAAARTGERWGFEGFGRAFHHDDELDPDVDEEEKVVLHPDRVLDVHVVDGSGAPAAGAPVALRFRDGDEASDALRTRTDARGLARLAHLQELLEDGSVTQEGMSVALALLALEPVELELPLGPLSREPLELVLPPVGALELQLVDAAGNPLAADGWIELELASRGERSADEQWRRKWLRVRNDDRRQRVFARGGRALVEPIGLALELEVRVQAEGWRPAEARARGPSQPGERALARVPVLEQRAVLRGELRTSKASPFAGRELTGDLWVDADEGDRGRGVAVRTDGAGRFEIELAEDWPLSGTLTLELHGDDPDGRRWWMRAEEPVTLAPGVNDFGAHVVERLPVLAAGRVVDPSGAPLAGAHVGLPGLPETWRQGWVGSESSNADGRFLLQGIVATRELLLGIQREGFAAREVEAANGAEDLLLTLFPAGGIQGSVLVSDERAFQALHATATSVEGQATEVALDQQGRFAFEDLAPGRYTVALVLDAEPEFECRVPDVRVEAGGNAGDTRLQQIDLRARLRTFGVTLRHPEGETIPWRSVRRRPAGTATYASAGGRSLDDPTFTTSHPALDLRITVDDCRTVELLSVAEDRTIELQPALGVTVRLVPPVVLGDGEWLELELDGLDGAPLPEHFGPRFFDGEHVETSLPEAGCYAVRLNFLQRAIGDPRPTPLPLSPGTLLRVEGRDGPQAFDVPLPPAALAAIAAARADPPPRKR